MTWLLRLIPGIGGLLSKGLDYYIAKADGNVRKAIALMEADRVRIQSQRDITIRAMSHPIWWLGWALFVLPLGIYWNKVIVYDKVLKLGATDPLTGFVLDWSGYIVLSLFGMQVGAGLAGAIINRVWR
jgi:hypothetical protein